MNPEKYSRTIQLVCPTCGSTRFSEPQGLVSDDTPIRCTGCSRRTTKAELISLNSANIDAHAKEMGDEVVKDLTKELKRTLGNAFRGSKHFRLK